jgi:hypothetical protein
VARSRVDNVSVVDPAGAGLPTAYPAGKPFSQFTASPTATEEDGLSSTSAPR